MELRLESRLATKVNGEGETRANDKDRHKQNNKDMHW